MDEDEEAEKEDHGDFPPIHSSSTSIILPFVSSSASFPFVGVSSSSSFSSIIGFSIFLLARLVFLLALLPRVFVWFPVC